MNWSNVIREKENYAFDSVTVIYQSESIKLCQVVFPYILKKKDKEVKVNNVNPFAGFFSFSLFFNTRKRIYSKIVSQKWNEKGKIPSPKSVIFFNKR